MFTPSRELREYMRARMDEIVRARTDYPRLEKLERELALCRPARRNLPTRVSGDVILRALREFAEKHGRSPTHAEWEVSRLRPNVITIRRRFGSWNEALRQAGLRVRQPKRATSTHCANGHRWTKESTYLRPNGRKQQCRVCSRESRARCERRAAR